MRPATRLEPRHTELQSGPLHPAGFMPGHPIQHLIQPGFVRCHQRTVSDANDRTDAVCSHRTFASLLFVYAHAGVRKPLDRCIRVPEGRVGRRVGEHLPRLCSNLRIPVVCPLVASYGRDRASELGEGDRH